MKSKLKRRIFGIGFASLVAVGLLMQTQAVVPHEPYGYFLLNAVRPEYPAAAVERGIEGSVTLQFTLTKRGKVKDPVIIESDPPGVFDLSAMEAVLRFSYRPNVVDGKPTEVEGVKHKINFQLENDQDESGIGVGEEIGEDQYHRFEKVRPEYPHRAVARGIEGSVTMEFTVTENGTVKDPIVVESDPPGIFDRSATQAVLKFRYLPRVIDGKPTPTEGIKHKITYELEDDPVELGGGSEDAIDEKDYLPLETVLSTYPPRALARGIEGSVIMKFTVTERGTVKDPVIVESDPPGIFDRAATQAVLKFRYPPRVVDGKPTEVEGVKHRIVFELDKDET